MERRKKDGTLPQTTRRFLLHLAVRSGSLPMTAWLPRRMI